MNIIKENMETKDTEKLVFLLIIIVTTFCLSDFNDKHR